ncbi:phytoene desaturase [Frankia sp. CNm7]|uniref:Phytoene desaturase n=1 Tax=Frankia nepalensis TaxID=1836974 RepID=A0A937RHN2_9ACTN|nr:phytoene desaturase family protein [Frankia nepalensis]MBL7502738.1 phytoene desaturase [Frankia nepalensis]MBL7515672.1 phytoene desaturase [Frankia nepalensis]MBL7518749.1 phytoene desaturase [Frankia nepalensis]MBL7626558.1 phytoene desaturase [Frankia nepalensis]
MRTVTGPTDHVVVVGAGLGGLSAALRLAGAGRRVTVLERADVPGGRAGVWRADGYQFDTGPTVLTMPDLLADAFAAVGEDLADWVTLRRLDPMYRARFADGSTIDVRADPAATAAGIEDICGPAEAAGYLRFVELVSALYRAEMRDFIDAQLDSPLALLRPSLARLAALGAFRRLDGLVGRHLRDPRTRRLFSFQAMYAGLAPHQALGVYAVISYMDSVAGVYHAEGGMHAVPAAMAAAATKHGVTVRYGATVTEVEVRGGRAVAVRTADGDRVAADVVVLNPDLPTAYRELLPPAAAPGRLARLRYSPSCFLLLAGAGEAAHPDAGRPDPAHHTIHFGQAWRRTFTEIISRGELMTDPSFLVSAPSLTEPGLAPAGGHAFHVLFPTPNTLAGATLDWSVLGRRYRDEVVATLEQRGYTGFGASIAVEQVTTPADWLTRGMTAGAPFAAAHTFRQTGPFRPSNRAPGLENVVFTGSGTRPGVGVPMVLISGRLAAERVVGPARTRRFRPLPAGAALPATALRNRNRLKKP